MSAAVPRHFRYALEPVRQQRDWKLQAAQATVARLQHELAECEARSRQLERQHADDAGRAVHAWRATRDPVSQRAALAYLARLQQRAVEWNQQAATLREQLVRAREACSARQQELEVLEQHREDAWDAAKAESQRREAAHADAEWSARLGAAGESA